MSFRLGALLCWLLFSLVPATPTGAQEPPRIPPAPPASPEAGGAETRPEGPPPVEALGEHRYRIGEIEFDAKSREIRLPAQVNLREGGPMEYLLVHEQGKVHEAILTTSASPLHLQIALKLLRYRAGAGDVFAPLLPDAERQEAERQADKRGEAVHFAFVAEGAAPLPAPTLVLDGERGEALREDHWIYTGSAVEEGRFRAEEEGSLVAIYLDPLALFNSPAEGADVDERWGANHRVLPAVGTKGHFLIRPASGAALASPEAPPAP